MPQTIVTASGKARFQPGSSNCFFTSFDNDDNFPRDTEHFRDDRRGVGDMMQDAEFADSIEAPLGERQRVAGRLEKGNAWRDSRGDTLLDKRGDGLYAADKRAGESHSELAQATSIRRTHIQEALDLQRTRRRETTSCRHAGSSAPSCLCMLSSSLPIKPENISPFTLPTTINIPYLVIRQFKVALGGVRLSVVRLHTKKFTFPGVT